MTMISSPAGRGRWSTAAVVLLALALGACWDSGGPKGNVGPTGTTVRSADGKASLAVPAGAVATPIEVGLAAATSGFTTDPALVGGTSYQLTAPDTALATEAELSIELPASITAAAADDAGRARALGAIGGGVGNVPVAVACSSDWSGCWFVDPNGKGCVNPPKYQYVGGNQPANIVYYPVLLGFDTNFTNAGLPDQGLGSYTGPASYCEKSAPPKPQIASLKGMVSGLVSTFDPTSRIVKTKLAALSSTYFGALLDVVPPTVKLSSLITPVDATTSKIKLSVAASDNRGVTRVTLVRMDAHSIGSDGNIVITTTPLAQFVAPPYDWESGPLAPGDLYGKSYIACGFDAANNQACDFVAPLEGPPTIANFGVAPATLPYGGGQVTLSWSAANASALTLDNGIGDVTGSAGSTASVSATTTFTLTAANPLGNSTAQVTVTVLPQPAPAISSFTATPSSLPVGGGPVTLAWSTSDATTLTIDNNVGVVTGTSTTANVSANTTFTLTAANGAGTATRTATVVVAAAGDRFVDPVAGSDSNPGTATAPYKTINKAMTGGSPVNVYLADGSYDTTTQGAGTIAVPDGVALRAVNAGNVTLSDLQLSFTGGGTLAGIALTNHAQVVANSASGAPSLTISGVRIHSTNDAQSGGATLQIGGNVKALMSPGALAGGVYTMPGATLGAAVRLSGTAQLTVQGGVFDGHGADDLGGPFVVTGNAKLVLDAVTIKAVRPYNASALGVITASGTGGGATVTLQNGTVVDGFDASTSIATNPAIVLGSNVSLTLDNAQLSNGQTGISASQAVSGTTVTLKGGTSLKALANAAVNLTASDATTSLVANNASISGGSSTSFGLRISGGQVDLNQLSVTGQQRGLSLSYYASLRMRNCAVTSNSYRAVDLYNGGSAPTDLGTIASPGGNTLTGSGDTNLSSLATATISAVGNTWDPNIQGADAAGHYAAGTVPANLTGKNFTASAGTTITL